MTEDESVATLKLSEASRRCGVSVHVLRLLAQDRKLPGAVRAATGHVYLREDAVPRWADLVRLIEGELVAHLKTARRASQRVESEIEAVRNDIELAIQDPYADLGDDLVSFRSYSHRHDRTSLTSALSRLEAATMAVRTYHDALSDTSRVI